MEKSAQLCQFCKQILSPREPNFYERRMDPPDAQGSYISCVRDRQRVERIRVCLSTTCFIQAQVWVRAGHPSAAAATNTAMEGRWDAKLRWEEILGWTRARVHAMELALQKSTDALAAVKASPGDLAMVMDLESILAEVSRVSDPASWTATP